MADASVSVVIIARDEADNLQDCLATLDWAREIVVVVDAASRDATEKVARRRADRVLVRPFDDFAGQRNAGIDLATSDWVFSIDADERVPPALAREVLEVTAGPNPAQVGFRVPIRSVILGRCFDYSGTQHDRPLRLFRRSQGRWQGLVHEVVQMAGPVGVLRSPLEHRTLPNMETFLRKLDAYTTLEAQQLWRARRPVRLLDLLVRPPWTFAKLYVLKQGFRDGLEGLLFCGLSGVSVAVRHWKHRELTGRAA